MKGDEYICRDCKKRWASEPRQSVFCPRCYGRDILNLSREERVRKSKAEAESRNRKKKEMAALLLRQKRREEDRSWEKKNRFYRGKGGN